MPKNLETDWKRVGRSGDTIDGRVISAEAIVQAAEDYDPEFYTALIWPDHQRWFNLGKVSKLRAEDNNEGGKDLYAKLIPNDYYLAMNNNGQRLFTSMELPLNFRESGRAYLEGLGATDNPASVATAEVQFSRVENKEALISVYVENSTHDFNDDESAPSWFTKFFAKDKEAMSQQAVKELQTQLTALANKFAAAFPEEKPAEEKPAEEKTQFAALENSIAELSAKFNELEGELAGKGEADNKEGQDQYKELKAALDDLTTQFKAALEEQPGTSAGEETGNEDLNAFI